MNKVFLSAFLASTCGLFKLQHLLYQPYLTGLKCRTSQHLINRVVSSAFSLLPMMFVAKSHGLGLFKSQQPVNTTILYKNWEGFIVWWNHFCLTGEQFHIYTPRILDKYASLLVNLHSLVLNDNGVVTLQIQSSFRKRTGQLVQHFARWRKEWDKKIHIFSDLTQHFHLIRLFKRRGFFTIGLSPLHLPANVLSFPLLTTHSSLSLQLVFINLLRNGQACSTYNQILPPR